MYRKVYTDKSRGDKIRRRKGRDDTERCGTLQSYVNGIGFGLESGGRMGVMVGAIGVQGHKGLI